MALSRPEPTDDCTQIAETDVYEVKTEPIEIDDSNLWAIREDLNCGSQGTSSITAVKSEPVDSSLRDWDGCGGVMKKDSDEVESGNELESPLFVKVKEELVDDTLFEEDTFKPSDSAQGPLAGTNGLTKDARCALVVSQLECQNCCHHCNSVGPQDLNKEECLIENRTQCLCKMSLKMRSLTEYEIPLGITTTSDIEKGIYDTAVEENKKKPSAVVQRTEIQDEKSVDKNSRRHLRNIDVDGKKTHKCSQCEKAFKSKSCLTTHMHIHTGEKPFKCSQCGKAFKSKSYLTTHMHIHTGERPFKCNQCGMAFHQSSHLNLHVRQHTGEKPFICNQCGKTFNHSSNLTSHMHTHTGKKPFKCNECGKAFNRKSHITTHMRIHTGEKPFQCKQCEMAFSHRSDLTKHMQRHTGETPFKCNKCEKAFNHRFSLTRHMQTHTNE